MPPDGVHTLRLTVRDAVQLSSSALRTVTVDTTPPAAPTGLRAEVRRTGAPVADIVVSWTPSGYPSVVGYRLQRGEDDPVDAARP